MFESDSLSAELLLGGGTASLRGPDAAIGGIEGADCLANVEDDLLLESPLFGLGATQLQVSLGQSLAGRDISERNRDDASNAVVE